MANTYITLQESPKYSANLLPEFAGFNENITWNVVDGGANAVVENNSARVYAGERALLCTFTGTGGITIDYADGLTFVAPQTGYYIISTRAFVQSLYDDADINHRIYGYVNGVNNSGLDFNVDSTANGFLFDKWNTFYQVFYMEKDDVFDCQLKFQSDTIGSKIYIDGFKIELDERSLGVPSRYTDSIETQQPYYFSFDYNDSGSSIAYTTGDVVLANDGAGAFTNTDFIPIQHQGIYNPTTDEFDFSSLSLGDVVLIRLDIDVTTTTVNQMINTFLELSQGASPYEIKFHSHQQFKTGASYPNLTIESRITMLNEDTLNNPAQFKFNSDNSATVVVNGFNVTVITKR